MPKVEDRIRKLLALARNNPSVHEAANAFARAQELAARHALDLDDMGELEPGTHAIFRDVERVTAQKLCSFRRAPLWLVRLADDLSKLHRCRCYYTTKVGIYAYGQPSDLHTVAYMFEAIRQEIDRLASVASRGMGRSWGRNFRLGAVDQIRCRLQRATDTAVRQAKEEAFAKGGDAALVRVSHALEREEKVREAVDAYGERLGLGRSSFRARGSYGYAEGRKAARGVTLSGKDAGARALKEG